MGLKLARKWPVTPRRLLVNDTTYSESRALPFSLPGEYVSDAAKVGQEAAADAAKATKEYAAAGAKKTQEAFNDYVSALSGARNELIGYVLGGACGDGHIARCERQSSRSSARRC